MSKISEHFIVPAAVLFSIVLIIGTYIFARGIESPSAAQAVAETTLLKEIASKDSDNDGLPNWEEELYGTNPNNPDSLGIGITDGEAVAKGLIVPKAITDISVATPSTNTSSTSLFDDSVPPAAEEGSITDTFAKNFFTQYMAEREANNGVNLSQDQVLALENKLINQITSSVSTAPDFKTKTEVKVSGSGPDALRLYAEQAEYVFRAHGTQFPKSELLYLRDAVQNDDSSALDNINEIATAYRAVAAGFSALTVPEELVDIHLALMNSMNRMGQESADFARLKTDSIATMLAVRQYMDTIKIFIKAFKDIESIYASEQVIIPDGTPGADFVNLIKNVKLKSQKQL